MTAARPLDPAHARAFRYLDHNFDATTGRLVCRYAIDDTPFEEHFAFSVPTAAAGGIEEALLAGALRLLFLLAGVSYFKAAAPPVIEVPHGLTSAERALLHKVYSEGLGEFAYRNGLDLSAVRIEADERPPSSAGPAPLRGRSMIPFGGGLDSIVTVEGVRAVTDDDLALFVLSREGDRFDAIEEAAAVTGLPVVRAERRLDPKILRSSELRYRNGHVPVTGILSAVAVVSAVLDDRDAVVMSNEWSASAGNFEWNGIDINHQWSKGLEFEDLFRAALAAGVPSGPDYYSWLRPRSELWVAREFARLTRYHRVFRSCNRAFHIDRAKRLDRWCGRCDKCSFIDLILSPFVAAADLEAVFGGREPLQQPDLLDRFLPLLGLSEDFKPFECVGDVDESRAAAVAAADRPDRASHALLQDLADRSRPASASPGDADVDRLLRPLGEHRIPPRHAPRDLLV